MIQLTDFATEIHFVVNHEQIARIDGDGKGGSFLYESLCDYTSFARVAEPPKEVVRKVLEYKLAMVRYQTASYAFDNAPDGTAVLADAAESKSDCKEILWNLAGAMSGFNGGESNA